MSNKSITGHYKGKAIRFRAREHMLDVKKRFMEAYQKQVAETVKPTAK